MKRVFADSLSLLFYEGNAEVFPEDGLIQVKNPKGAVVQEASRWLDNLEDIPAYARRQLGFPFFPRHTVLNTKVRVYWKGLRPTIDPMGPNAEGSYIIKRRTL